MKTIDMEETLYIYHLEKEKVIVGRNQKEQKTKVLLGEKSSDI